MVCLKTTFMQVSCPPLLITMIDLAALCIPAERIYTSSLISSASLCPGDSAVAFLHCDAVYLPSPLAQVDTKLTNMHQMKNYKVAEFKIIASKWIV